MQEALIDGELSEEQLEAVAGGTGEEIKKSKHYTTTEQV